MALPDKIGLKRDFWKFWKSSIIEAGNWTRHCGVRVQDSNHFTITAWIKIKGCWDYLLIILTLLGLTSIFYTEAWGGVKFHPPLKIGLFWKISTFYHYEVNFYINPALFWCVTPVSSSILANFSNFIEKIANFGHF